MSDLDGSEPYVILGADGMLGRAWVELLAERKRPAHAAVYPRFDLSDPASIEAAIPPSCRVVINCAAHTDVDGAESNEALATELNGAAVGRLVRRCDAIGARLVHYSTDYVFDGRAREAPYPVDHPTDPVNAYGRSKLVGERLVAESDGAHLVIRTSWLYAPWGKNFVRTIAQLARERDSLRVVDDQRGRPTSAQHLAASSLALLMHEQTGTFHVTDGGACTWFEFASAIASHTLPSSRPACRVEPCTTDEFPRPARRPAYSVLDLRRTEAAIGEMPPWQENLAAVLTRLDP